MRRVDVHMWVPSQRPGELWQVQSRAPVSNLFINGSELFGGILSTIMRRRLNLKLWVPIVITSNFLIYRIWRNLVCCLVDGQYKDLQKLPVLTACRTPPWLMFYVADDVLFIWFTTGYMYSVLLILSFVFLRSIFDHNLCLEKIGG